MKSPCGRKVLGFPYPSMQLMELMEVEGLGVILSSVRFKDVQGFEAS